MVSWNFVRLRQKKKKNVAIRSALRQPYLPYVVSKSSAQKAIWDWVQLETDEFGLDWKYEI